MAICETCGAESARIKCRWKESQRLPDQCPNCAPQEFQETFKAVHAGEIVMAHEYDHTKYKTVDGIPQITDEGLTDIEDSMTKPPEDERIALEIAIEKKRQERRTTPMSLLEIDLAAQGIRNRFESAKSRSTR